MSIYFQNNSLLIPFQFHYFYTRWASSKAKPMKKQRRRYALDSFIFIGSIQSITINLNFSLSFSRFSVYVLFKVKNKFVNVYAIGFVYWPIAQTINFAFVPVRNQVIYVSVASLIWTTFLAYMKVRTKFSWDLNY